MPTAPSVRRLDVVGPLQPLEIGVGRTLEPHRRSRSRRPGSAGPGPREVLEDILLDALTRGRVSVSFSGGRDSSLLLAVAAHVARREGLELPVPVTIRHYAREAEESEWQELVLSHLGISDWEQVEVGDTMDLLGAEATRILTATGVQAPPNAYLAAPAVQAAAAGTLITGAGGDELLGAVPPRAVRVVHRRDPPERRDVVRIGFAVAPQVVRREVLRRRLAPPYPWLTAEARRAVGRRLARTDAREQLRWDRAIREYGSSRVVHKGLEALSAIGAVYGVFVQSPLMQPEFIEAFARSVGPAGPISRTVTMRMLASDLLPDRVLDRQTKATFGAMVWGPAFRAFAEEWEPSTLDPEVAALVDVGGLRQEWRKDVPWFGSMMLAQRAWLDQRGLSRG